MSQRPTRGPHRRPIMGPTSPISGTRAALCAVCLVCCLVCPVLSRLCLVCCHVCGLFVLAAALCACRSECALLIRRFAALVDSFVRRLVGLSVCEFCASLSCLSTVGASGRRLCPSDMPVKGRSQSCWFSTSIGTSLSRLSIEATDH